MSESENFSQTTQVQSDIVKALLDGTITESQQGTIVKKVQIAVGGSLLKSIESMTNQFNELDSTISKVLVNLKTKLEEEVDLMTTDELLSIYEKLSAVQNRSAELTRKVAQGKPLFDFPVLSDDERQVALLMSSFSSQEEKHKFLQLAKNWMSSVSEKTETPVQESEDFE